MDGEVLDNNSGNKPYAAKKCGNAYDDDEEDEDIAAIKVATKKRSIEAFIEERLAKKPAFGTDRSDLMPFINIDDDAVDSSENATTTEGILPLLNILELPCMRTCTRPRERAITTQLPLLHVQQKDKWSCGYRNLQMLLSAIVPQLPPDHPYYTPLPTSLKRSDIGVAVPIPSLTQLQTFLEKAWREGFDPRGANFYQGKILGKKSQIGAIEVSSLISWLSLDSVVIQFIKTLDSRTLLGPYVWSYFSKMGAQCYICSRFTFTPVTCLVAAETLLKHATTTKEVEIAFCNCPLPPLYLQWEGHSVTVVGVQRRGSSEGGFDYDLLVFDPLKDGDFLQKSLSRAFELENTAAAVAPMLLPVCNFYDKDSQIVMTSVRPLTGSEKDTFRRRINAITATRKAHMKQVNAGKEGNHNNSR